MRILILALALAACSPPTQEAEPPASEQSPPTVPVEITRDPNTLSSNPASTWEDVASDPQLIGQWHFTEARSGAFANASFGSESTEAPFAWVCDRNRRVIMISREIVLAPDQATGLAFIIPGARHLFAAQSSNEGMPHVAAEVPASDARLDAIAASEEGFAVQVAGDTTRIRHDPMLARVLAACRT